MHLLQVLLGSCLSPVGLVILLVAGGIWLSVVNRALNLRNDLLIAGAFLLLLFTFSPLGEIAIGAIACFREQSL